VLPSRGLRRSPALVVTILCPHFERPVRATQNGTTEQLVDCDSKDSCAHEERDPTSGVVLTIRPAACPVFRSRS
jgi:hypothetical protein